MDLGQKLGFRPWLNGLPVGSRRFPTAHRGTQVPASPRSFSFTAGYHSLLRRFQRAATNDWIGNSTIAALQQHPLEPNPLGWALAISLPRHYFSHSWFFLFLHVLRWFTSLSFARTRLCIHRAVLRFYRSAFPLVTPRVKAACGSSRLIAACTPSSPLLPRITMRP